MQSVNDFTYVNPYLGQLKEKEQAMFRGIWILRTNLASLKIVINEDQVTAARCLLKLGLHSNEELKIELIGLCAVLCRSVPGFAKEVAAMEEVEQLVQPYDTCSNDPLPIVPYILSLEDKYIAQACAFASHLNLMLTESLEKGVCDRSTRQAIQFLWILVRNRKIRQYFRTISGIQNVLSVVSRLLLEDQVSLSQTVYECLCISWVSLYDPEGVAIVYENRIIPIVHCVLKKNTKEKCIRMGIQVLETLIWQHGRDNTLEASFASTLSYNPASAGLRLYIDMANSGMLKTIRTLLKKNWEDLDIPEKFKILENILLSKIESMTSFTEYRGELQSGYLEWTPVHTNAKFWKDNLKNIESNEFEILGCLRDVLLNATNETSIAVACHDIGQVIRYHPHGRKLLGLPVLSGAKERIIDLMQHTSVEVRKHALLSIQKIMVQKWEFIG